MIEYEFQSDKIQIERAALQKLEHELSKHKWNDTIGVGCWCVSVLEHVVLHNTHFAHQIEFIHSYKMLVCAVAVRFRMFFSLSIRISKRYVSTVDVSHWRAVDFRSFCFGELPWSHIFFGHSVMMSFGISFLRQSAIMRDYSKKRKQDGFGTRTEHSPDITQANVVTHIYTTYRPIHRIVFFFFYALMPARVTAVVTDKNRKNIRLLCVCI